MEQIKISIRNMVEFVYRSGDIDSGYMSSQRALDGIRIHKRIQAMRKSKALKDGGTYESEYTFRLEFLYKGYSIKTEGRADGLLIAGDGVTIEEIKSTTKDPDEIYAPPEHWHWAQAKCYGHMYCESARVGEITICLTYCNTETMNYKSISHQFSREELSRFFYDTIERMFAFSKMDADRKELRNTTANELPFPFGAYRSGQRELAVSVYAAIKAGKNLFAHAPTGIGKTVSTLYPSVKALQMGLAEKIFYLTSRNTGRIAAADCLKLLEEKGLSMVSINLSAKTKICVLDEPKCNPYDCARALGHFDRVNTAILDILSKETIITREILEAYAQSHNVCPFELGLDVALFSDCVICDYNYVYDPASKLKRFFSGDMKNNFVLLIDEAHNLVDRAREMFSASLERRALNEIQALFKGKKHPIKTAAGKIKKIMDQIGNDCLKDETGRGAAHALPDTLYYTLQDLRKEMDAWLALNQSSEGFSKILDIYFDMLDFMRILELYDDSFITIISKPRKTGELRIICLDPSFQIFTANKLITSAVYFSATLNHMDFFMSVLGGVEDDFKILMPSPFKRENLCVLVNTSISTKYKDRDLSYESISKMVFAATSPKKGNYMVFFPSYIYMEKVYECFQGEYSGVRTVVQVQGDTSGGFLESFKKDNAETVVGFAVLGAGYSEGIDLAGDLLIGVVVVGVGLPMISLERDVIKEYYDGKNGDGYGFAYKYPGMNKILQAGGRVIRKEDDRGFILLIDSRYRHSEYIELMPGEWLGYKLVQSERAVRESLLEFWEV